MNDRRSVLTTIWIMGIISIVFSVMFLFLNFLLGIFSNNSVPYLGGQAFSYVNLFVLLPIIAIILTTISIHQFRIQHYRKAYVFSLIPPVLYALYMITPLL